MSAKILTGKEVAAAINDRTFNLIAEAKGEGVTPTIAFLRVGEKADDLAYQNSAIRRCEKMGIAYKLFHLPQEAPQKALMKMIEEINQDPEIHGVLMLRPLRGHFDEKAACAAIRPDKDIDGITNGSLVGTFIGEAIGYPPCTAQAVLEILKYYKIPVKGRRVVVVGRSLVIGRPVSLMLLRENATVTICHSHTRELADICRQADVLVVTTGHMDVVDDTCFHAGQTVIDVGIHVEPDGTIRGDLDWEEAKDKVAAITPVPGGVGTVTTAVLMSHVAEAACKAIR